MRFNEKTIIEKLESLNEDIMSRDVIVPLYKRRFKGKYHEIEFTGGNKVTEQGCDVTYYEITHDTKAKEYTGVQVKQGNIDSSKNPNTGIASISIQAEQAFTKKMYNTKDKTSYYIKTFVILTTGNVLPVARSIIVDKFAEKNIRFIEGKEIAKWIAESYEDEFADYFHLMDSVVELKELDESEVVVNYIREKHNKSVIELRKSFTPYGFNSKISKIIIFILENGKSTAFEIAKGLGRRKESIEEELKELISEKIVDVDEEGFGVSSESFSEYLIIKEESLNRIEQLGYDSEKLIDEVMEALIC
jgi:hypothetical protein